MTEHIVASASEIGDGERLVVEVNGREIGIFCVDDEYYAYLNWCLHQSGPICEGRITGTIEADYDGNSQNPNLNYCREDEILNCPWHGWEYDVTDGDCLSRDGHRLPSYDVTVKDGNIILDV